MFVVESMIWTLAETPLGISSVGADFGGWWYSEAIFLLAVLRLEVVAVPISVTR